MMFDTDMADRPTLRRDLQSLVRQGHRRAYRMVVDEVSGRFARVSDQVWQKLQSGDADPSLWRAAQAAGWTRRRTESQAPRFNPLYVRVPIASVDRLAAKLVPLTGWLFDPLAVLGWSLLIVVAIILAAFRLGEITTSLGSLPQFFVQSSPIWLGIIFVATKVAHELGHAIVCRKVGSRCGQVGVLMLCGIPCPYCDVTDVWRQESTVKRIAVMLAGIYVELVLASLATFVWVVAVDPAIRLHALNLMVVCGISTLLFNANPLMRYDGYYVLSDLVGSVNLRVEAAQAYHGCVVRPLAGPHYLVASQGGLRAVSLCLYHVLSKIYRIVVAIAIATFLLGIAGIFQLRPLATTVLIMAAMIGMLGVAGRWVGIIGGLGNWRLVPPSRRTGLALALLLLIGFGLFVPMPRYRAATGWIDAADSVAVYLAYEGRIDRVGFDFGDSVSAGDSLVQVTDDTMRIRDAKLQGSVRLAGLRRDLATRVSIDRSESAKQWKTLKEAEQAVKKQLASVQNRIAQGEVVAPVGGVVLPPSHSVDIQHPTTLSLHHRVGRSSRGNQSWCRISPSGKVEAVLILDARDRRSIQVGSPVNVSLVSSGKVFATRVQSVSTIEQETESVLRRSQYQVLCRLPDVASDELLGWLGRECQAVFRLPDRSLAEELGGWLQRWIDGEMS